MGLWKCLQQVGHTQGLSVHLPVGWATRVVFLGHVWSCFSSHPFCLKNSHKCSLASNPEAQGCGSPSWGAQPGHEQPLPSQPGPIQQQARGYACPMERTPLLACLGTGTGQPLFLMPALAFHT